jgi:hypothetical protein
MPSTARFALPDGWNYGDLRQFLESELQEDFGSDYNWIWLRDFTDTDVFYTAGDGDLIQRSYTVVSGDVQWGQPQEVVARTTYQPVASMSAYPVATFGATENGFVLRKGKVFEAAEYADKAFAITPEELAAAAAAFTPVPNNIEHGGSVLDGHLGELRSVEVRGKDLFGTIAIPQWLHETIGEKPIKVSLEWARKTKRIVGNALVLNPRVPDAALMAAFSSAQETPETLPAPTDEQTSAVTLWQTLKALFTGAGTQVPPPAATPPARAEEQVQMGTTVTTPPQETEREKELRTEIEALRRKDIERDAASFTQSEFTARKVLPAEAPIVTALFAQALADDRANDAVVTFSDAKGAEQKVSRVDALKALFAARPAHNLTAEQVGNPTLVVLSNTTTNSDDPDGSKEAAANATAWAARENGTTGK